MIRPTLPDTPNYTTLRGTIDLVDQLFNSSEKRLARILLLMANFGKEGRPEPIIAKIGQEHWRR